MWDLLFMNRRFTLILGYNIIDILMVDLKVAILDFASI